MDELAPKLTRDCLVVGKSTVPVGTAALLADRLGRLTPAGITAELAWNPEFLREGFAVRDTLQPDRLVVGTSSARADAGLRDVYAPLLELGTPYISTDLATAELAKVAANAFLATKISFINAVADVCEAAGADVVTLAETLGHDKRIGRHFLSAGLGFGGGCLPKDIRAFVARADELGAADSVRFLTEVDEVNNARRRHAVDLARDLVRGSFAGRRVAILGAAFKPNTDDVRESPALEVAAAIRAEGALVRVHDPKAIDNARSKRPELDYCDEPEKACEGADVVLHLTEWKDYLELDPARLGSVVRAPRILDGRNVLPLARWRDAGWTVRSMGRPPALSGSAGQRTDAVRLRPPCRSPSAGIVVTGAVLGGPQGRDAQVVLGGLELAEHPLAESPAAAERHLQPGAGPGLRRHGRGPVRHRDHGRAAVPRCPRLPPALWPPSAVVPLCYRRIMAVRRKRSISIPPELDAEIAAAAQAAGMSYSAWIAQTARKEFIIRAGLKAVSQYEAGYGPFTPDEIAEADEWATRVTQPSGTQRTA